jgi:hypothetical protein
MGKSQHNAAKAEKSERKFSTKGKEGKKHKSKVDILNKSAPVSAGQGSASLTQQSVYKRETIYPLPTPWYTGPRNRFLTPNDADYERILASSYSGYALEAKECFQQDFHSKFLNSLQSLDEKGIFQFDITQPAGLGTKIAKTFVTRCLVGDAGTTYKYLGLRMFSLPWDEIDAGSEIQAECRAISEVNQELISHTKNLLEEQRRPVRGHQYNLTLINRYRLIYQLLIHTLIFCRSSPLSSSHLFSSVAQMLSRV